MEYYCNVCHRTISADEFFGSMNRYRKALCRDHMPLSGDGVTRGLQELMRERQGGGQKEEPRLVTVKDWVGADFETWEREIKRREEEKRVKKG